ncbi:MAG: helix-turn-helix transcriptional regulator [Candidatus Bathyarchaeota archaeon]|nr:MAG: helix-turn-helix transcriptional regulator [Candidatus Bathyarchaeota archaeon]
MERKTLTQTFRKQIVQRITRNFLDILILRLIQTEPMWGYKIIKKTERLFGLEIRHGALYPLLNSMEAKGYLRSQKKTERGRVRKVYKITSKGIQLVDAYYDFLKEQLQRLDIKEA